MKPRPLCLLCTFRTAYDLARRSTNDEELQTRVTIETIKWLSTVNELEAVTPAVLHTQVCRMAKRITGNQDPFLKLKRFSNHQALKMLPLLEREIESSHEAKEAFQLAVKMAICGNAIDFEVENYDFSLERFGDQFVSCLDKNLAIDDTGPLMQHLERSGKVLYLLDNAGEIVFDRLLIELTKKIYGCEIWAAVKDGPVVNDALMDNAEQVGLTSVVPVITTGNDHIGVDLRNSSDVFLGHLKGSDLILAKGQGSYETLTELETELRISVCYLLRAKCPVVAESLGVPLNSSVVRFVVPRPI